MSLKPFSNSNLQKYLSKGFICEKHQHSDLFIYGYYSHDNIVWDEVNVHLRGMIADSDGNIHARSFKKFFTFKSYLSPTTVLLADNQYVQLKSPIRKIYEKIDGCLVMLYWIGDEPFLATQRSFTSNKAIKATDILHQKYRSTFSEFKRDRTYIFEAVFAENRIVVDYGNEEELYLIGIIDNETGKELPLENIGFKLPRDYTDEFSLVKDLKVLQNLNIPNKEGFVLTYEDGLKIKIKFPWYQQMHAIHDKLVSLYEQCYMEIRKLKAFANLSERYLSNVDIYNCLNQGKPVSSILTDIPPIHFLYGVERWINEIVDEYNQQKELLQNQPSSITELKPEVEKFFNLNTLNEGLRDTRMWNFRNRIEAMYC